MGHFSESIDGCEIRKGETFTCAHCNAPVEFRDDKGMFKPPTMCAAEHKPLCERCARETNRIGHCVPFEKRLLEMESRDRMLRSMGVG